VKKLEALAEYQGEDGDFLSEGQPVRKTAGLSLAALVVIYAICYIDRTIINVLLQSIKVDLRLTDTELGLIGGLAFGILYAGMGLPLARIGERSSRRNLLAVSLTIWSVMTALCGAAFNFWHLFLARLGVGVGEAGCNPSAQSMISDLYPAHKRSTALAIYSLGVPIGTLLGAVLGGWLGQSIGWRLAFVVVGAPGLIIALLLRMFMPEPVRGALDARTAFSDETPTLKQAIATLWKSVAFRYLVIAFTFAGIAGYSINAFMTAFLLRRYELTLVQASVGYGLMYGATGLLGIMLGGAMADRLGKKDRRAYGWLPGCAHIIAAPLLILALTRTDVVWMAVLIFVPALLYTTYLGPGYSIAHNLVSPRMRATTTAILLAISTLAGLCMGPPLVGWISDVASRRLYSGNFDADCVGAAIANVACTNASAVGLMYGLVAAAALFLCSGMCFLQAGRHFSAEVARTEAD